MADVDSQPVQGALEIEDHERNGARVLTLRGELDLATTPDFERAVSRICADDPIALLLDLRGLRFLDATGMRAMLTAKALCEEHECRLLLTHPHPEVERLFELTEAAPVFPFIASHDPRA